MTLSAGSSKGPEVRSSRQTCKLQGGSSQARHSPEIDEGAPPNADQWRTVTGSALVRADKPMSRRVCGKLKEMSRRASRFHCP
eukprot:1090177-Rhodomonas_salina.1